MEKAFINTFIGPPCKLVKCLLAKVFLSLEAIINPGFCRGSALGLGIAYCGSNRDDVIQILVPLLSDPRSTMEEIGIAALALGMISVGSCNGDVTSAILQTLMEKSEAHLKDTNARFLAIGLGLCYLQKQV